MSGISIAALFAPESASPVAATPKPKSNPPQSAGEGSVSISAASLTTVTTFSPAAAAAVAYAAQLPTGHGSGQAATTAAVFSSLSNILAQGQGGYVLNFQTPGGGVITTLSPLQLTAILNGRDPGFKIGGYNLSNELRLALGKPSATEHISHGAPSVSPYQQDLETALGILQRAATGKTPSVPSSQPADGTSDLLHSFDSSTGVGITLAYVPPGQSVTTETGSSISLNLQPPPISLVA